MKKFFARLLESCLTVILAPLLYPTWYSWQAHERRMLTKAASVQQSVVSDHVWKNCPELRERAVRCDGGKPGA